MSKWKVRIALAGGLLLSFAILLGDVVLGVFSGKREPQAVSAGMRSAGADSLLRPEEAHLVKLFEKASRSVVFITNTAVRRGFFFDTSKEVAQGSGSGFVWDKKGHVVTNYHVIAGADSVIVSFDSKTS